VSLPAEIRTARLLLRSWRADDASSLQPILETNQDHLGPWIPARIAEPAPTAILAERLAGFARNFAADREWRFGMFCEDTGMTLGEVALFPRAASGRVPLADADHVEIGYWLRVDQTGRGFVTEAAQALLDVASRFPQFSRAEIRCDDRNGASAAIPRRLGFDLATTIPDSATALGASQRHLQVWTLQLPHPARSSPEAVPSVNFGSAVGHAMEGPVLKHERLVAFAATTDGQRAAAFYERTLGLRVRSDDAFAIVLDANSVELRLQKVERFTPQPFTVLGWQVNDIISVVDSLKRGGVAFERYSWLEQDDRGVWKAPSGALVAWFKDPDGNLLSVAQYAAG
jgi:RimJ/RimL family protein N-acetyltransferase/catechol 2,3-dioxygenase-like lactoylglutathione lyase family enzyme